MWAPRHGRCGDVTGQPRRCDKSVEALCWGSAVPVPATLSELAEDDEIAAVDRDDLPVAPADRPVGPPAVLDEPRLAHGHDLVVVDHLRAPPGAGEDGGAARGAEAAGPGAHSSNGASTARRSGTR